MDVPAAVLVQTVVDDVDDLLVLVDAVAVLEAVVVAAVVEEVAVDVALG